MLPHLRTKLPDTRNSITHRVVIGGKIKLYFTVGTYDDGKPGELFVHLDQEEGSLSGALKCWALSVSLLLQHGEYETVIRKFWRQRFEPAGFTDNPEIPNCLSIPDYIAAWMNARFGKLMETE